MVSDKPKDKNVKGDTFYMTQANVRKLTPVLYGTTSNLRIGALNFTRMLVIYSLILAESLLVARLLTNFFKGDGSDLLTFMIYGLSYPIVSLFSFVGPIDQIPSQSTNFELATFWAACVFLILSLSILYLIKILKLEIKK